ncbi:SPO22-domain-containing protein [Wilcoxina mikolae CBS 423.85]|nr:SPO22-domain-containing protein [Wilcoxina mikolae CBS 423.85]
MSLEAMELQWASKVMERAALYHGALLKGAKTIGRDAEAALSGLTSEFFTIRMMLAWRQQNPPLAEYMFSKATENDCSEPRVAEYTAAVLFDIGSELLGQKSFPAAIKWLQRAYDILSKIEPLYLSEVGSELQVPVAHKLAKAYMKSDLPGGLTRAENIINILSEDWPNRISVFLLKLDLILAQSPESADMAAYRQIILHMIDVTQLTETTFKVIIGKIHVLVSNHATEHACNCLDALISKRLLPMECEDWLNRAFITRLYVTIQHKSTDDESAIANLHSLLDTIAKQLQKTFNPISTHAAQILLWRVSETLYVQEKYHLCSAWCQLALHMVFDRSGELNLSKISRRIILCSINTKEYGKAAEVFNAMPESGKNAPLSRFLMFKVALRTSDDDLALSCLASIAENPSTDQQLLYACALDSQEVGNRKLALRTLKLVLDSLETFPPSEASKAPILLRCIIRLTMTEIEGASDAKNNIESLLHGLANTGTSALKHATRSRQMPHAVTGGTQIFDINELDWFSRNGYNLGLRSIMEWGPATSLRIINACIGFMKLYPEDMGSSEYAEIIRRRLLCYYLCAALCIEIARMADDLESKLQHYLLVRNHVESFRTLLGDWSGRIERGFDEVKDKLAILLPFDFEGAIQLKNWGVIGQLVDEAILLDNGTVLQVIADVVICSCAPENVVLLVLKRILDHLVTVPDTNLENLARWIRYTVQFSLVRDSQTAEAIISQALELARNAKADNVYPDEELHWLTATAWNRSIDFTCASDEANATRFSDLAFSLARLLKDDTLLKYIQGRLLDEKTRK